SVPQRAESGSRPHHTVIHHTARETPAARGGGRRACESSERAICSWRCRRESIPSIHEDKFVQVKQQSAGGGETMLLPIVDEPSHLVGGCITLHRQNERTLDL